MTEKLVDALDTKKILKIFIKFHKIMCHSRIQSVICRSFAVIDETTLPLLFRSLVLVRPHLEYANTVWGAIQP